MSWPRSNVRFSGVVRTITHQELAAVIGTGLEEVIGTGFLGRDSSQFSEPGTRNPELGTRNSGLSTELESRSSSLWGGETVREGS